MSESDGKNVIYQGYMACTRGPIPPLVRKRGVVEYTVMDEVFDPDLQQMVTKARKERFTHIVPAAGGWNLWPRNLLGAADGFQQRAIDEVALLGLTELAQRRRKAGKVLSRGSTIRLRPGPQEEAYAALEANDFNGAVVLAPGKGKTVLALRVAQDLELPVLVILENSGLMQQWRDQARAFLGVEEHDTGVIRGPYEKWSWQKGFVVASYKSLLIQMDAGAVPDDFWRWWGLVVWDEAHHCQAPELSRTLPLFPCRRIALTATPHVCGREAIYFNHTGWPVYRDVTPDIYPEVSVLGVPMPNDSLEFLNPKNKTSYGRLLATALDVTARQKQHFYLDAVADLLADLREQNRTVLVISSRVAAMTYLRDKLERERGVDSVVVSEAVPFDARISKYRAHDLVFVSRKIGTEALDRKELDTVVFITPVGKGHSGQVAIQQGAGRATRALSGKTKAYFHIVYPDCPYGRQLASANILAAKDMGFTLGEDGSAKALLDRQKEVERKQKAAASARSSATRGEAASNALARAAAALASPKRPPARKEPS